MMMMIMMEASLSKKRIKTSRKKKGGYSRHCSNIKPNRKNTRERERKNSISHHHFSLQCIRSLIFFSLFFSKTVHLSVSFSRFLFLSPSLSFSLSPTICFSISVYILLLVSFHSRTRKGEQK